MARPYALLRAGFPYLKTLGYLLVTGSPIDVAVAKDKRLFILGRGNSVGRIARITWEDEDLGTVLDPFVRVPSPTAPRFSATSPDKLLIRWPAAMIFDRDENLIISDEALNTISFLTQDGEFIDQWGEHGNGPGQFDRPAGMALDADDNLFVVDAQNHRVQKFTRGGEYMHSWGSYGTGPGEFDMPWGIHIDELGDVYVVDWHNDRVQKFTADGEFVLEFGSSGDGEGQLHRPAGIAVDAEGDIYVADAGNDRVSLFNAEGRYVDKFVGDSTLSKSGRNYIMTNARELRLRDMARQEPDKRFRRPTSVRVDDEGRMFVTDYYSSRVQIYQKDVVYLDESQIWAPQRAPSLLMP